MRFTRENSIPYEILISLKDLATGIAPLIFTSPYSMAEGMRHIDRHITGRDVAKGFSQLKKRGLIKERKKDGQQYVELTRKGRLEIVRYRLKEKTKDRWDGKWRIVIFDIPEITRRDRDFLRSQLKWLGFLELQKRYGYFPMTSKQTSKPS